MERIKAETPSVWDQIRRNVGNPWLRFAVARAFGAWPKGHRIEGGKTYSDTKARGDGADSFYNLPQKTCAILEASSIGPLASMCTQEFMAQIPVAMLDIHEI